MKCRRHDEILAMSARVVHISASPSTTDAMMTFLSSPRFFWMAAAALMILMGLLRLHTLHEPFERDITGYAYTAHQMLHGKELYVDVWDHKPPAMPYLYALFEAVFGYDDIAIYLLGLTCASISLLLVGLIAKELAPHPTALIAMVFFGLLAQSGPIQSNQPNAEAVINAFKLIGIYAAIRAMRADAQKATPLLLLAGLAVGLSSTAKTVVLFTSLALAAGLLIWRTPELIRWRWCGRRVGLFAAAAGGLWGAIFAVHFLTGTLHAFWNAVFVYNSTYMARPIWESLFDYLFHIGAFYPKYLSWEMGVAAGALAFLGTLVIHDRRPQKLFLLLLALAAAVELAAPGKFFLHYYQLLVPFACIAAAWGAIDLGRALWPRHPVRTAALIALPIALLQAAHTAVFLETTPEEIAIQKADSDLFVLTKEVGLQFRERLRPELSLFEWGAETGLYYYSKLSSPNPFFYYYPVVFGSGPSHQERMVQFFRGLMARPSDLFVDFTDRERVHGIRPVINQMLEIDKYLETFYTPYQEIGPFRIFCNNRLTVRQGTARRCVIEREGADTTRPTEGAGT